jgi:hypothetical protein
MDDLKMVSPETDVPDQMRATTARLRTDRTIVHSNKN